MFWMMVEIIRQFFAFIVIAFVVKYMNIEKTHDNADMSRI